VLAVFNENSVQNLEYLSGFSCGQNYDYSIRFRVSFVIQTAIQFNDIHHYDIHTFQLTVVIWLMPGSYS